MVATPLGVKSAPETFQRVMDQMLEGIGGTRAILDDILVAGKDEQDHDRILQAVVNRATEYNICINFEKCQIKKKRVKYVARVVSDNGLEPCPDKVKT